MPEKNQYAFKLEGFDEDWTFTDQRSATYTNLSPGSYSFRVKVANSDGIWNFGLFHPSGKRGGLS
jgi:hypothetical protein